MELSKALSKQLDTFHTYAQPYDDPLNIWLHQAYADVIREGKNVNFGDIYFSPSSANACPRSLYHKAKKAKRDVKAWQPHQRRWVSLGTMIGDMLQYEMLLCERHYEKMTGTKPRFTMALVDGGTRPAFEDFIFKQHKVEHNGEKFSLLGTSDGIMVDNETGNLVGLEIKSKQQTPSTTSIRAMTSPKDDHIRQCVCYSIMYGVDKYVIAYYNGAKKAWDMSEEDYAKTPDLRLFDVDVSQSQKNDVLDFFADITRRVRENDPPLPDLLKWKFNDYKTEIARTLTNEEMASLEAIAPFVAEDLPAWQQRSVQAAMDEIKLLRG